MAQLNLQNKEVKERNKILFYGLPLMTVVIVFLSLLYVVLPTINNFLQTRKDNKVLAENETVVNQSIANLKAAKANEIDLDRYNGIIVEMVPQESKLGSIINTIQEKAKDFSLEYKFTLDNDTKRTSLTNLSETDKDDKSLFERLDSGEVVFNLKDGNPNISAVLITVEVSIKGTRDNYKNFLNEMKATKPLINLVYVDYSETKDSVDSTIRFESYALKYKDTNQVIQTVQLKDDDNKLLTKMTVEEFMVDNEKFQKLLTQNSPALNP